ncbi:oligosaccharyl transferase subunit OST3/OST6 family [Cristinia sonorae]|uniref:Oligosaccharyl transferase subunit OST3/OST6 family n=1 Tax=Cristinia sonorae TaxID=1940300 RepID=A0A8K0UZW7_9AGAR|nr:oligosaccharyl transferase subunit OST3/OST6 family [Cristinia sonorae]
MLLWHLLALFSAPLCFAAPKDASSAHDELVKLANANNGLIKLDDRTYDLLTHPKRTWSAAVQLTAMDPRRRCIPCKEFDPSFKEVARAWSTVPAADRDTHFFATLDFDNGMSVFQKLGLQSAPIVHVHPAAEGPRKPANGKTAPSAYDFSFGFDPAPLAEQLSHHTPIPIPYKAPIDWSRWGTAAGFVVLFISSLRFLTPVFTSKWTWAAGTVITSLVMTSGYMFTRIRGAPWSGGNGNWIAPGYQNQFGQETQVVAMIYGLLAASFLMLTVVTPYTTSPSRQKLQVYLWTIVIFIMFSVLLSLFRVKNRGYPFKLLL